MRRRIAGPGGGGAHHRERRVEAGPELERERGLVHEHAEPVGGVGSRGRGRRRGTGVSIGWYTVSTTNWPGLRRSTGTGPGSPCIPSGVAFTTRANTPGSTSSSVVAVAAGHEPGGGVGGVAAAGRDGHPGAGAPQGEHDRPGGAAGAGDEHVGARGVEALVAHRAQEALAVGGRPGEPAVVGDGDHVHRAEGGWRRR